MVPTTSVLLSFERNTVVPNRIYIVFLTFFLKSINQCFIDHQKHINTETVSLVIHAVSMGNPKGTNRSADRGRPITVNHFTFHISHSKLTIIYPTHSLL